MLDARREEMLQAMGVRMLYSRLQMPGAKIPAMVPVAIPDVLPGADPASADQRHLSPQTEVIPVEGEVPVQSTGRSLSASISRELDLPAPAPVAATVMHDSKPREKALRFRCRIIRINELLMLVDQPMLEWHEANKAKPFFADIYFALTGKIPEFWSEAEFDWPPSRQFPHANNKAMAREALQSFLQQQLQQSGCNWLLAWGDRLGDNLFDQMPQAGMGFIGSASVLLLEPLQYYWQDPPKKKLLWQMLQVVSKSLGANVRHD